jgi:hypothetical protein
MVKEADMAELKYNDENFDDDEFSESTLQAVNEKGKKQGWTLARSDGGKWRIISEGY